MTDSLDVAVVLVTYNRLEKLKIALESYEAQELRPKVIIVVDNCSTDGTPLFLNAWLNRECGIEKQVILLDSNTGGAGGFRRGFEAFLSEGDWGWVWVADDDAYPKPDAIRKLSEFYSGLTDLERKGVAVLASSVINKGKLHNDHRNMIRKTTLKWKILGASDEDYAKPSFEFDIFSYVGTMIKRESLIQAGLTNADYFIYGDDQEHAIRISRTGKMVCIPDSKVVHDTDGFGVRAIGWGHYYHIRNNLITRKTHLAKRYFILPLIKGYLSNASPLSLNPKCVRKLYASAYIDALKGVKGKHALYRPGFSMPED